MDVRPMGQGLSAVVWMFCVDRGTGRLEVGLLLLLCFALGRFIGRLATLYPHVELRLEGWG
jgi:hypothetical protein